MVTQFQENSKPIYLQIADRICDEVMQDVYPPDGRLPSVREYAARVQVNVNTVMRAYDHLASAGVIFNKRGIGYFVCSDAGMQINTIREATFYNDEINYFFQRLSTMGVTPEQLSDIYNQYLQK